MRRVRADAGAWEGGGVVSDLSMDGVTPDEVRLTSIHNFRDVAGPGYQLVPTGTMSRGIVYRSTTLALGGEDLSLLERLGVATVVDLRTPDEIAKQPDVVPTGAEYFSVDVLAGNTSAATFTGAGTFSVEDARREMSLTYEQFVVGDAERVGFGQALQALATSSGPSIVHCTAGKDRTGWISAVLQMLAGVRAADVMADYMLTRELSADFIAAIRSFVETEMPDQLEAINVLIDVDESNLRRSLDAMVREFGDVRRYLMEGAGLEATVIDDFGARLRK